MTKALAGFALLASTLVVASVMPARAQLGSVNNPPPQHLFNTDPVPRLDNGLGTMAERRARLAQIKRMQRPVRHPAQ